MFKKKLLILLTGVTLISSIIIGCGGKTSSSEEMLSISGSTSVGPLIEAEVEAYKDVNSQISIEVNQLGTSAGIKNVIDGISELGMASRDLKPEERKSGVQATKIAYDVISIITNNNNPVKNLSIEELKDIYTGKITNWKDVGGNDSPIVVVSREEGSGTRASFDEIIGYKSDELTKEATIADGSGNIKSTVAGNHNAIGYMSLGYLDDSVKALTIDNIEPNGDNVKNGKYKVSRAFLLVYKNESLSSNGKEFLDYILSNEGQKIVKEQGLITIK